MQGPELRTELAEIFRLHHAMGHLNREVLEEDHQEQADYLISARPYLQSAREVAVYLTQNLALPNRPRLTVNEVLPLAIHCWMILKTYTSSHQKVKVWPLTLTVRESMVRAGGADLSQPSSDL